jgi:uncharacterized protein (TIGR02246 family)
MGFSSFGAIKLARTFVFCHPNSKFIIVTDMETDGNVRRVYSSLIAGWNAGDAGAMTHDFAEDAEIVGFDGTEMSGRARIAEYLGGIFANHRVASFVTLVREVRTIAPGVSLLRAEVGMVPPGGSQINPATNAVQTLLVAEHDGIWQVVLFQNTPAAWHGRENDVKALTAELQDAFEAGGDSR